MSKEKEKDKAKSLAELAGVGGVFEGVVVPMANIEGTAVKVIDFKFIPSQFREGEDFLSVQIKIGDELKVVNTSAVVVVRAFKAITREMLPAPATFVKVKPASGGREYWTIE